MTTFRSRPSIRPVRLAAALLLALGGAAHGAAWEAVTPGVSLGMDGKVHAPKCTGVLGLDSTFRFWARRGSVANTVIYFEGGGACWDSFSCSLPGGRPVPQGMPNLYTPMIPPTTDPSTFRGLFDAHEPANPFRDWNVVYIPYCSADIHAGSADRIYLDILTGQPLPVAHHGFDNFMSVMNWVRGNLPVPRRVLVSGASAGGYGASINFPWVAKAWPLARTAVFADASQGVTTPAWDAGLNAQWPGRASWNMQLEPGSYGGAASVPSDQLLEKAARAHPNVRVGQFTTTFDAVQVAFYDVMQRGYAGPTTCANRSIDWNTKMLAKVADLSTLANYRHYIASGDYHTILRDPALYTEASGGMTVAAWLDAMVNDGFGKGAMKPGNPGRHGDWQNMACQGPGCRAPVACP